MAQCYDEIVGDDYLSWSNVMTREWGTTIFHGPMLWRDSGGEGGGGRLSFMVQCYDEIVGGGGGETVFQYSPTVQIV